MSYFAVMHILNYAIQKSRFSTFICRSYKVPIAVIRFVGVYYSCNQMRIYSKPPVIICTPALCNGSTFGSFIYSVLIKMFQVAASVAACTGRIIDTAITPTAAAPDIFSKYFFFS